jgi:uracil-DNA glycosylase
MFTGDSSGDWLYEALHRTGFASLATSVSRDDGQQLTDCWITAAGRCAPPDNKPTPEELARCRPYLAAELGCSRARESCSHSAGSDTRPGSGRADGGSGCHRASGRCSRTAAEHVMPDGIVLMSSFHPSRQNTQTGRLTRAMWLRVFERARERVSERS